MDIRVKQERRGDCGPACLASVARSYNLDVPLSRIREKAGTNQNGTYLLALIHAAKEFGFEAKGVRGVLKHLYRVPLPAIAHML